MVETRDLVLILPIQVTKMELGKLVETRDHETSHSLGCT